MMGLVEVVAVVNIVMFLAGLVQVGEQAGVTGTLAEVLMLEGSTLHSPPQSARTPLGH